MTETMTLQQLIATRARAWRYELACQAADYEWAKVEAASWRRLRWDCEGAMEALGVTPEALT